MTWIAAIVGAVAASLLWLTGVKVLGPIPQGVCAGIGLHQLCYWLCSEGRKMGSMRLQKDKVLRALRLAKDKAKILIDKQRKKPYIPQR